MTSLRVPSALAMLSLSMFAVSCGGRVQSAGPGQPVTIRLSTGFPTGNFRPFSEALVKGYARADARRPHRSRSTRAGSLQQHRRAAGRHRRHRARAGRHCLHGLQRPAARVGAAAARHSRHRRPQFLSRASAGRPRLVESARWTNCGGAASVSAPTAAAPPSSLRRCWTVTSLRATCRKSTRPCRETNAMLLDNALDAAFTISSVPNDDAKHLTEAGARLLPIRGPAVDRLRTMYPFFRSEIIPAGVVPRAGSTRPHALGRCRAPRARGSR